MGCPVRLWLLQPDADIRDHRPYRDVPLQAAQLVCVLSDGHDDAGDMQAEVPSMSN